MTSTFASAIVRGIGKPASSDSLSCTACTCFLSLLAFLDALRRSDFSLSSSSEGGAIILASASSSDCHPPPRVALSHLGAPRAGVAGAAAGTVATAASSEGARGAALRAVVVPAAAAPPLRVLTPAPCLSPTRAASAPCLCRAGVLFFVARLLQRRAAGVSITISST